MKTMLRGKVGFGRIFEAVELDGYYVGDEICAHITFESEETIVIDLFDDVRAAQGDDDSDVVAAPVVINLRTGKVRRECPGSRAHCEDYKESCEKSYCWLKN